MSSQPEQLLNENPVGRRWLRAVRAFALASLLEILLFMCALTVFGISSKEADPTILSGVLLFVPVCFPYAWIYWRLRSKIGKTVKKNLALSIGFGTFALLFSLFVWLVIPNIEDVWKSDLVIGIFALSQLSLIVTAIKAYYAMRREPRDYRILLPRLALGSFLLVLCLAAVMVPNLARDSTLKTGTGSGTLGVSTGNSEGIIRPLILAPPNRAHRELSHYSIPRSSPPSVIMSPQI